MNDYVYDDPRVSYDEPGFFYDGGFAEGYGPSTSSRRIFGGSGASSFKSSNMKRDFFEILIRTSKLNEDSPLTRIYQVGKKPVAKVTTNGISIITNRTKVSGSLIL